MSSCVDPNPVSPLEHNGVLYEAPPFDYERERATAPAGIGPGFVVASDASTLEQLWTLRIFDSPPDELVGGYWPVYITRLEMEGPDLVAVDERKWAFRVELSTRKVARIEDREWPAVNPADCEIYRAVLRHLTQIHGISDWRVSATVRDYPDQGAVLRYRPSGQDPLVLEPDLKSDLGTRRLQLEEYGGDSGSEISFSRIRRDATNQLAITSVTGPGLMMREFLVKLNGSVDEFEYSWDYNGAYGLPNTPVSTQEAISGGLEFLQKKVAELPVEGNPMLQSIALMMKFKKHWPQDCILTLLGPPKKDSPMAIAGAALQQNVPSLNLPEGRWLAVLSITDQLYLAGSVNACKGRLQMEGEAPEIEGQNFEQQELENVHLVLEVSARGLTSGTFHFRIKATGQQIAGTLENVPTIIKYGMQLEKIPEGEPESAPCKFTLQTLWAAALGLDPTHDQPLDLELDHDLRLDL